MELYWPKKDVLKAGQDALAKQKPSKKLIGYLDKYQQDLLTTGTPEGLPSFTTQRDALLAIMREKYAGGQGYHQTISGWSADLPKFWELMLSMDFVSHEIELTNNIDYDDREIAAGIRSTIKAPYAEFTIVGEDLKQRVAQTAEPATPNPPADIVTAQPVPAKQRAWLTMPDKFVFAELSNGKPVKINEQELRTDLAPYSLMKRLLEHPTVPVTLKFANEKLEGCEDVRNLGEVIRQCGFDEAKKKMFFEISTAKKVKLKKDVYLTPDDVALLTK